MMRVTRLVDGMFDGMDYIKCIYPFYMSNPDNYFFYLLEKDGKLECCTYRYVVDDGDTLVNGAARTHPDYQGKGYMGMLRTLADDDVTKRLPKKPSRHLYAAFDAEFHRERTVRNPNKYKIVYIEHFIARKATKSAIALFVSPEGVHLQENNICSKIWKPSDEEIANILCQQPAKKRLFPDDCFVANIEPYKPIPSKREAGIGGHRTNHSLRAATASRLYASKVDEQLICETTGHRSNSVRSYKRTNQDQRKANSAILYGHTVQNQSSSEMHVPSVSVTNGEDKIDKINVTVNVNVA